MLDRDSGEREDWARCEDGDGALCFMLHSRIGIAFVHTGMLSESTLVYLARFHVVNVDSFAADEWRLDLVALRSGGAGDRPTRLSGGGGSRADVLM